jgi:hypothetical protein
VTVGGKVDESRLALEIETVNPHIRTLIGSSLASIGLLAGCVFVDERQAERPMAAAPAAPAGAFANREPGVSQPSDLTQPGAVARAVANPTIIDTRQREAGLELLSPAFGPETRPRDILPDHALPPEVEARLRGEGGGGERAIENATLGSERLTSTQRLFPGIANTGWTPPDPSIAVGPSHVVQVVNSRIAWFSKTGASQFSQDLQPFFSSVGAGGFCFDPKAFYDHYARRYVVVALEVYGTTESYITIAVSDDDDPNGVWYRYRTDAVITVGQQTYWWDYPGFGYDADAIYVTGNLFGLNAGGFGGVGFRVYDKAAMYAGQPAVYSTLRDGNGASVQVAQCFGDNAAPYFASVSGSAIRLQAIVNPLTAPVLSTRNVTIPAWNGPSQPPTAGGQTISAVDGRVFNMQWRDGQLYVTHHVSTGGKTLARWYQVRTNNWPLSGTPALERSGTIDPGGDVHTFFPAIYANRFGDVGIVVGTSSPTQRIGVAVAGKLAAQANFGALTTLTTSPVNSGGRWGDYYDIAVDPNDDTLLWAVGEYAESFGWSNWIGSFRVGTQAGPTANPDVLGTTIGTMEVVADVLANDTHFENLAVTISAFDATTARGGTVRRLVGQGPGGRDVLAYTPPAAYIGPDSFMYTSRDSAGRTSNAAVSATVVDLSQYRVPENPTRTVAGLDAAYYNLGSPTQIPDYDGRTPASTGTVADLNFAPTTGPFAGSGRSNAVGALFTGYVVAPTTDIYTFYTSSDDGSRLKIGTTTVVDNDGVHTMRERSGTIALRAGVHAIRVEFFERDASAGLIVSMQSSTMAKQVIPAASYSRPSPCRADFNNDGFLDFFDYDDFVVAYETGSAGADFNGDGFVDFFDYDDFVAAYETGC